MKWGLQVSEIGAAQSEVDPVNRSTGGPGPTSQWPRWRDPRCQVSRGGSRRRRPKARRRPAGVRRKMHTVHGSARAWARSNERAEAHLAGAVAWPEEDRSITGDERGGRRRSAARGKRRCSTAASTLNGQEASTGACELNKHEPRTKWSPDGCRRRARAVTRSGVHRARS